MHEFVQAGVWSWSFTLSVKQLEATFPKTAKLFWRLTNRHETAPGFANKQAAPVQSWYLQVDTLSSSTSTEFLS